MINNVTLVGRLVRDPELKYTASNIANTKVTLAVNRRFKNATGEREADFINLVLWKQNAENFANWMHKGGLVGIVGSIQTRNYENQQGQRVYVTEVLVDHFQSLESRPENQSNQQHPRQPAPVQSRQENPFSNSKPMDISDDELPF
ncbi:single-stranded DNA-binding protein [Lactovum miscens]|uniref:Single-stranded DNA-binding protein n=1 Tax=Lactovum miscens TaxID=190387 RepID=A0A841C5V3_9LACT|nr:single-stranded DNA-binding protein [Lactovum miscens]MBB5887724.1 single-strand DNA-binding protein [Lactovum miscens]